jgi:hypothetical protein
MTQWQVPLAIQLIPGFVVLAIVPFCPETPRWLCKKDRWEDAEHVLSDIRQLPSSHPYVIREMAEMRAEISFETMITGQHPTFWTKLKQLSKKGIRNRVAIGLCLMMYAFHSIIFCGFKLNVIGVKI